MERTSYYCGFLAKPSWPLGPLSKWAVAQSPPAYSPCARWAPGSACLYFPSLCLPAAVYPERRGLHLDFCLSMVAPALASRAASRIHLLVHSEVPRVCLVLEAWVRSRSEQPDPRRTETKPEQPWKAKGCWGAWQPPAPLPAAHSGSGSCLQLSSECNQQARLYQLSPPTNLPAPQAGSHLHNSLALLVEGGQQVSAGEREGEGWVGLRDQAWAGALEKLKQGVENTCWLSGFPREILSCRWGDRAARAGWRLMVNQPQEWELPQC